jgi:hypothetical protein
MEIAVIDEPALEFGYSGTHVEQRAGLVMHGPADIEMDGRCGQIRIGVVGSAAAVDDVRSYLRACCKGIAAKDTELIELFPAFPGCDASTSFRCRLTFGKTHTRSMSSTTLAPIVDAETDDQRIRAGVEICSGEIRRLVERSHVDVVIVARPNGIPDGVDATGKAIGANFHDLLDRHRTGDRAAAFATLDQATNSPIGSGRDYTESLDRNAAAVTPAPPQPEMDRGDGWHELQVANPI